MQTRSLSPARPKIDPSTEIKSFVLWSLRVARSILSIQPQPKWKTIPRLPRSLTYPQSQTLYRSSRHLTSLAKSSNMQSLQVLRTSGCSPVLKMTKQAMPPAMQDSTSSTTEAAYLCYLPVRIGTHSFSIHLRKHRFAVSFKILYDPINQSNMTHLMPGHQTILTLRASRLAIRFWRFVLLGPFFIGDLIELHRQLLGFLDVR